MNPVLRVKNVSKVYKTDAVETTALRAINLEIQPGEFTALAGPSGSGKSTLLHLMGGLDKPSAGEVWLGDTLVNTLSRARLADLRLWNLGFVFQAYNLIPVLTALENAAFVLELRGEGAAAREAKARSALETLNMLEFAGRRPNQLSGGQQQRVAVARALAAASKLILADEPTANLDSKTGMALIEHLRRLNRESGVTFLFSSHDPRLLERVDRVVRLEDGQITT